jgi:TetR/AcrR family transcriptional regulator, transcriptional repressor of bet genes
MARPALISREDLADAVVAIVVESGLDAVSIRTVASRAGVSPGAVQHHFASKDDLLLAAYGRAIDGFTARAAGLPDPREQPLPYVRELLLQLLPLDNRREAELRVAIAFTARSVHNPRLAALYAEGYEALVDAVAKALAGAVERGEVPGGIEPRREAARAVALADGLAWHSLGAPARLSPAEAAKLLEAHLSATLGG